MNCPNCGAPLNDGVKFCPDCGAKLTDAYAKAESYEPARPTVYTNATVSYELPPQNRPLSPWAYFGYSLLFSIPLVGFICLIVFSFSDENINRRNYARSYWCAMLVAVVISIILVASGLALGVTDQIASMANNVSM